MELVEFLKKINLPNDLFEIVIELIEKNKEKYLQYVGNLTSYDTAEKEYNHLKKVYNNDCYNYEILSIYALASLKSYELYKKRGIKENIFFDTFKCITRFSIECERITGKRYFDRDFWLIRQMSLKIFRIGELEYEFVNDNENRYISIHIPSDSVLTRENINQSLKKLEKFIANFFKEFCFCKIICDSWLLSLELKKYLNSDSKILIFQSYFEIIEIDLNDMGFIRWLYNIINFENIDSLPEKTSLQRKIKTALLKGEKIGKAIGVLKKIA